MKLNETDPAIDDIIDLIQFECGLLNARELRQPEFTISVKSDGYMINVSLRGFTPQTYYIQRDPYTQAVLLTDLDRRQLAYVHACLKQRRRSLDVAR